MEKFSKINKTVKYLSSSYLIQKKKSESLPETKDFSIAFLQTQVDIFLVNFF